MPGFEAIGDEEKMSVLSIFDEGNGVLFRHGFDSLRGSSHKVREFETMFSRTLGIPDALAVSSGSAALRVALAALQIGPGDEVITQSFTFVATVEAIVEAGATPVIVEVDHTLNMDPLDLREKISSRTKAIIPVHMLGTPADLESIMAIASEFSLPIIEDTAWGCGGSLRGKPLGTFGDFGCFSFDFAKTITTGEGGMVIARESERLSRAKAWHDHGHENNPLVPRWEDTRSSSGFNFRMSELQGAVGLAQIAKLHEIVSRQRYVHASLVEEIAPIKGVCLRKEPEGSRATHDALIFSVPSPLQAKLIRQLLVERSIGTTKILPEAISWHFAGSWDHIDMLRRSHPRLESAFPKSREILARSVSLPISILDDGSSHKAISGIVQEVLQD